MVTLLIENFDRASKKVPKLSAPETPNQPSFYPLLPKMKVGFNVSFSQFGFFSFQLIVKNNPPQFANLLGTVYCRGNLVFTPDGNSLLSPVGNRVSCFDLVKCAYQFFMRALEEMLLISGFAATSPSPLVSSTGTTSQD